MLCKLCRSAQTQFLFEACDRHGRRLVSQDRFGVFACHGCGVVFVDMDVHEGYYSRYYPSQYHESERTGSFLSRLEHALQISCFRRRDHLIRRFHSRGGRILEVGCGRGEFLHWLGPDFEKHALEIHPAACVYIREHEPQIHLMQGDVEVLDSGDVPSFDVIGMWHVLEHVSDPRACLERLSRRLAPGGVMIVEIPNRDSLGLRLTGPLWFHLDAPRHLFLFNRQALGGLLETCGLEIIHYDANPWDYFQDLSVSLFMKWGARGGLFRRALAFLGIVPAGVLRIVNALFCPAQAEINRYVLKKQPARHKNA